MKLILEERNGQVGIFCTAGVNKRQPGHTQPHFHFQILYYSYHIIYGEEGEKVVVVMNREEEEKSRAGGTFFILCSFIHSTFSLSLICW